MINKIVDFGPLTENVMRNNFRVLKNINLQDISTPITLTLQPGLDAAIENVFGFIPAGVIVASANAAYSYVELVSATSQAITIRTGATVPITMTLLLV